MSAIHLIKKRDPKLKLQLPSINLEPEIGEGVLSSGNWCLSMRTARELIGGRIHFHEKQAEPSFEGGTIIRAEPSTVPKRVVFYFRSEKQCEGVITQREGWAQVMKLVP